MFPHLVLLLLLVSLVNAEKVCFPFPVMVLRPSTNFPDESCMQIKHATPKPHCLRQPIDATLEVYEGKESPDSFYEPEDIQTIFNGKQNNISLTCLEMNQLSVEYANTTISMNTYNNISIHFRGSSSLNFRQKHQYSMKLKTPANLLNVGNVPERHWILYGEWLDGTLLRNSLAHWLFRSTGRYSPHTKPFVFFIEEDGEDDSRELKYYGLMLLMESITASRLDLSSLEPYCKDDELSGGWLWEYNPYKYGRVFANMKYDAAFLNYGMAQRPRIVYPKKLTKSMRDYFVDGKTGFLPQYYHYLYSSMADSPNELSAHINIDSFVDYMLHTELSLNTDSYRRSVWFFKDRNSPINAGPVWDFNLAYGSGISGSNNETWIFQNHLSWRALECNYIFSGRFIQRWQELRQDQWSDKNIQQYVVQQTLPMKLMLKKCPYNLWQSDLVYCLLVNPTGTETFEKNVESLVGSVLARAQWMDDHITEIYRKLDKSFCGMEDRIPEYNCAADGSVKDCMISPMKYANMIQNSNQQQPLRSVTKTCKNQPDVESEPVTVDSCWLSVGDENLGQSPSTLFCSGFGTCDDDKDAKCQCNNNMKTDDCLTPKPRKVAIQKKNKLIHQPIKLPNSHNTNNASNNASMKGKPSTNPKASYGVFSGSLILYWFCLLCLLVCLIAIFIYKLRSNRDYEPLLNRRSSQHNQYGSSDE